MPLDKASRVYSACSMFKVTSMRSCLLAVLVSIVRLTSFLRRLSLLIPNK